MKLTSTALRCTWVVILAVLAVGCGSESGDQAKEPPVSSESTSPSESTSGSPAPSGPAEKAVADLATRLGIDAASVEVLGDEPVTWSDGSMGCAERGMAYTQALVEGSRITLQAEGVSYEYHTGGSPEPFWCENPTE